MQVKKEHSEKMNKKDIEAKHYDEKASETQSNISGIEFTLSKSDRLLRQAHFCYINKAKMESTADTQLKILDYGCGTGVKHFAIIGNNNLYGIDVSQKSIELANKFARENKLNAEYHVMDCENTSFENSTFDILLDYGTFSSLDFDKSSKEIVRILKSKSTVVAIETLGHNPITNLKRLINVLRGKRTKWAASHIMKTDDWKKISKLFEKTEISYFGFFVIFLGPIASFCPEFILKIAEVFDSLFFKIKPFRKFAFKTVVILRNPIK